MNSKHRKLDHCNAVSAHIWTQRHRLWIGSIFYSATYCIVWDMQRLYTKFTVNISLSLLYHQSTGGKIDAINDWLNSL